MSRASHREHAGLLACRQTFFDLFPGCWIRDFFLQESTSVPQRLNPISVSDSQIGLGCRSLRTFCRSRDALVSLPKKLCRVLQSFLGNQLYRDLSKVLRKLENLENFHRKNKKTSRKLQENRGKLARKSRKSQDLKIAKSRVSHFKTPKK